MEANRGISNRIPGIASQLCRWERCLFVPSSLSPALSLLAKKSVGGIIIVVGRMLLLSLVTHIPQSTEGEGEEEERGCRSRTMTDRDHLPFWGAEIGQWLGKHVPSLFHSLSLSDPTLSHFYPIPTKPKIA